MFGIGSTELLIIMVVALVLLGPSKLPEIMKTIGKGINEFRRMTSDVKSTLEREIERAEEVKRVEEIRKELFDDQPVHTELEQEAAEAAEAAKKLADADAAPVEAVKPVAVAPDDAAQAEATKLVDAAKAEAARLIATAQTEANKLLETPQTAATAKAPETSATPEAAAKPAEAAKTVKVAQGEAHA